MRAGGGKKDRGPEHRLREKGHSTHNVCAHACDMKTTKEAHGEHSSDTHLSGYREGLPGERTFKP